MTSNQPLGRGGCQSPCFVCVVGVFLHSLLVPIMFGLSTSNKALFSTHIHTHTHTHTRVVNKITHKKTIQVYMIIFFR